MKVLFVTPFYPYPLDIAGKIGLYNFLKCLSKYHHIILLSFFNPEQDLYTPLLKDYCAEVITIKKIKKEPAPYISFIKTIFPFTMPCLIRSRYEPLMRKKLVELINAEKFDIILYEFTQSAIYIQSNISTPQVLVEDDISYLNAERRFDVVPWRSPLLKLINYVEYLKLRRFERKAWTKVDTVVTLTESDKERIKQINPNVNVAAIVRGVDFEYYKPNRKEQDLKEQVLFLGAAENTLNIDGIGFFLQKIWPLILCKKPKTTFRIIGKGFGDVFNKTKLKNVEEIGFVKDTRPYFDSSKVFVVPLLNSSGIKMKMLEAMAMGIPVVSTSIGAQGIDAENGKDIIIADKPQDFAESVLRLLEDKMLREKIGINSRKLIESKYNWDIICRQLENGLVNLKEYDKQGGEYFTDWKR